MSQAVEGDDEQVEVVKLDDDIVSEGDPKDQTWSSILVRLLLALAGIGVLKQGLSHSGSSLDALMDLGFSVDFFFSMIWCSCSHFHFLHFS
jgi:hypothetical protein